MWEVVSSSTYRRPVQYIHEKYHTFVLIEWQWHRGFKTDSFIAIIETTLWSLSCFISSLYTY